VGTEVIRNKGDNETENRKTTEKNHWHQKLVLWEDKVNKSSQSDQGKNHKWPISGMTEMMSLCTANVKSCEQLYCW
jgi:hypothetical protein